MVKKSTEIEALYKKGLNKTQIAKRLKISRNTVIKALKTIENENNLPKQEDTKTNTVVEDVHSAERVVDSKDDLFGRIQVSPLPQGVQIPSGNLPSFRAGQNNANANDHTEDFNNVNVAENPKNKALQTISEQVICSEIRGIYNAANLLFDNFSFYQSKPLKEADVRATALCFIEAYPEKHLMNSKVLFWLLLSGMFIGNITAKSISKSFNKMKNAIKK